MQEYKEKFIWNNFLNYLKRNDKNIIENLDEMSVDSQEIENNIYDEEFLEENEMILDD